MSRTEAQLRPFLGSNVRALNVATGLLSQLMDRTGPNKAHTLDPNGRMALPAIAALLACEKLQIQDLDQLTAQRNSHVSSKHFLNALQVSRFAIAASNSSSHPNSPANARTPTRGAPGGARTPTRSSPAHASASKRRGATVSFYKLGKETLEDEDLPQKVVEWAETVKQRLREEEGVQRMVDLDGEDEMRGIWAWVCQAWGIKSTSSPSSRLLRLLETHLSDLPDKISAASPHPPLVTSKPKPTTPSSSSRPTRANATASTSQPTTPTKASASSPTEPSALSPTKTTTATTPTKSAQPPSTPTSSRSALIRTPTKPSPAPTATPSSTHTSRSAASQSHAHTPSGQGSPLKRQLRRDSPPATAGERTPTQRTPTRSAAAKRKYVEESDEGSGSDDEMALGSGRKVGGTMLEKGKGRATPVSTPKAKPKKVSAGAGRRYKSYIDGVGGGEEAVERGWKRYLAWREVHLQALITREASASAGEGGMDIDVDAAMT